MPTVASYCTTFLKPEMLHIYRQVTGLQRYRTVVITKERQQPERFPFGSIRVLPKPKKNFLRRFYLKHILHAPAIFYRGEFQVLQGELWRSGADLMHIYFGHTGVHLLPFVQAWKKPCIVSFHGADVMARPDRGNYDENLRLLLQTVPLVLARSESLAARLRELGCPAEKIRLNRTGIPLEAFPFQVRRSPENGAWRFVQACRLIRKKGLRTALLAFAAFHAKYPQSRFVIAGEGPLEEELRAQIAGAGLSEAVELCGFLSQGELAKLYATAHCFVHPSELTEDQNQEGVPNSMLEAMASGLPVLATRHGGIPEAVAHGESGLLVAERDAEGLGASMEQMAAIEGLLPRMSAAAADSVREKFESRAQISRLEDYYDEARALPRV